jgi:hypothetical protein
MKKELTLEIANGLSIKTLSKLHKCIQKEFPNVILTINIKRLSGKVETLSITDLCSKEQYTMLYNKVFMRNTNND